MRLPLAALAHGGLSERVRGLPEVVGGVKITQCVQCVTAGRMRSAAKTADGQVEPRKVANFRTDRI